MCVGFIQVNRNTWRERLRSQRAERRYSDTTGNAGGGILLDYLTKHAIRKTEDKQAGGNLARANLFRFQRRSERRWTLSGSAAKSRVEKSRRSLHREKFQVVSAGNEIGAEKLLREMNRFPFVAQNSERNSMSNSRYPSLYQINTRVWLTELSQTLGRRPRWTISPTPSWIAWPHWVSTGSGS